MSKKLSMCSKCLYDFIFAIKSRWASQLNSNLMSSRMRATLKFPSRGKGLFALRKSLKVQKNALCTVERDPDNISGELMIKKVILGKFSDACCEYQGMMGGPSMHIMRN